MNVVNRQLVAVLTIGTLTDAEMLSGQPDASYLLALTERPVHASSPKAAPFASAEPALAPPKSAADCNRTNNDPQEPPEGATSRAPGQGQSLSRPGDTLSADKDTVVFGACFIDAATSRVLIGQWCALWSHIMLHVHLCVHVHPPGSVQVDRLELSVKRLDSTRHPYRTRLGAIRICHCPCT